MKYLAFIYLLVFSSVLFGQGSYAPPVGQAGTKAMYKDSSAFVGWGSTSLINPGPQNIQDLSLGNANVGDVNSPIGIADGNVISLGDGGNVIVTFSQKIQNGPGNDFAVFENSFSDDFLELAFVEVSSDGINYFRFPSHSETQIDNQIGSFGSVDATELNNLAGKYKAQFGTPFDLNELDGISGLDINYISHVKIIDCIGSIDSNFGSFDSFGNIINEPYPTGFGSGGFDLDAIGVIHQKPIGLNENSIQVNVYPNPVVNMLNVNAPQLIQIILKDVNGRVLSKSNEGTISTGHLSPGIYLVSVTTQLGSVTKQIVKN